MAGYGYNVDPAKYKQTKKVGKVYKKGVEQEGDEWYVFVPKSQTKKQEEHNKFIDDSYTEHTPTQVPLTRRKLLGVEDEPFLKGSYIESGGHSYIHPQWSKENRNNIKDMNPGHSGWLASFPHVGPGNKILPKATNAIDNVARTHDIAYANASSNDNVRKADREFLEELAKIKPNTWGETAVKKIAETGIKIKSGVEHVIGKTLYPKGLPGISILT